ncbi:MAG: calcium/sodium antiporter [bacterium]
MLYVFFALGFVMLIAGADLLVRTSSELAGRLGIPAVIVGLTVVAYGTSAPEIVFTYQAAWNGQTNLAVANVVGSNILNQYLILGIAAIILPLRVHRKLIELDIPLVIGLGTGVLLASLDGAIGVIEGGVLFVGWFLYTGCSIYFVREESRGVKEEFKETVSSDDHLSFIDRASSVLLGFGLIAGVGLLVFGAQLFSEGAVSIARYLGVSNWVIGATVVAAGTSSPELATSVVAAIGGRDDVAVANVIGSSLFNILGGLGGASVISAAPLPISSAVQFFDLPVMVVGLFVCLPFALSEFKLSRWEGAVLILYFTVYTVLLLDVWLPAWFETFRSTVVLFGPLLLMTVFESLRSMLPSKD